MGAIVLVGPILLLDLRILGHGGDVKADALSRMASPLAFAGLAVMVASGAVLFLADPAAIARSALFQTKLVLIALAVINAFVFRRRWRTIGQTPPAAARAQAAASIALWLGVVAAGRLIAYY